MTADGNHKVHLLRSGADDYVIKPFGIPNWPFCEAALHRYRKAADKDFVVRTGPLTVDLVLRAVAATRDAYR